MRRGLAALALLLFALPAMAERYGPITITPLPGFGAPEQGQYYEYRFRIENRSGETHAVRLQIRSISHGANFESRSSRAFTVAPHSAVVAHLPDLITTTYTAGSARVAIDGDSEGREISLKEDATWARDFDVKVLAGRTVPLNAFPGPALHRTELAPSEWSASWLQYARFDAALLTAQDWAGLPPPVRTAILQWTAAGGWLVFLGEPEGLPALRPPTAGDRYGFHGLGRVSVVAAGSPLDSDFQVALTKWGSTRDDVPATQTRTELPLLEGHRLPVKSLFAVLLAFAVIGGPLNLLALAKKNRRVWIFWTLPALALVTSAVLFGATILDEGWVRVHRSRSLTLLDENRGEATTLGVSGIYATMAPRGEVVFDAATALQAEGHVMNAETLWDDGQRLSGSWVETRVPTYFFLRRAEPRRERLPLRLSARGLSAVNGLGSRIERLWVAMPDGSILTAANVAPGSEVVLARDPKVPRVRENVADVAERIVPRTHNWQALVGIGENDPAALLRPGMYVAVLHDSKFVPVALERATTASARGVVIGFQKTMRAGGGHAR